jgi:hypothetical protein
MVQLAFRWGKKGCSTLQKAFGACKVFGVDLKKVCRTDSPCKPPKSRSKTKVVVGTMLWESVRDRSGKPGAKRGLGTQSSEAKIATEGRNGVADRRSPDPKGNAQINDFNNLTLR